MMGNEILGCMRQARAALHQLLDILVVLDTSLKRKKKKGNHSHISQQRNHIQQMGLKKTCSYNGQRGDRTQDLRIISTTL